MLKHTAIFFPGFLTSIPNFYTILNYRPADGYKAKSNELEFVTNEYIVMGLAEQKS